jgi:hypothetical protein
MGWRTEKPKTIKDLEVINLQVLYCHGNLIQCVGGGSGVPMELNKSCNLLYRDSFEDAIKKYEKK